MDGAKFLLTGAGSVKIAVGSNYLGGSFTKTRTLDGTTQDTGQVQAGDLQGGGQSASASAQRQPRWDDDEPNGDDVASPC